MKSLKFLLLLLSFQTFIYSQHGWFQQQSNTTVGLHAVYFINENTGFAAGGWIFLKTTNGGTDWIPSTIGGNTAQAKDVYFKNESTGFLVGSYELLGRTMIAMTTNGGDNWEYTLYSNIDHLNGIAFIDSDNGIVVGGNGTNGGKILRTSDGGISWTEISSPAYYNLNKIAMLQDGTCMTVGDSDILKSIDSGRTWIRPAFIPFQLKALFLINSNTAIAGGSDNSIFKTVNGGQNWYNVQYGGSNFWYGVFFINEMTGWVSGDGVLLKTANSGESWTLQGGFAGSIYDIFFVNSNTGYLSASNGRLYKTTNGGNPLGIQPISTEIPNDFSLSQNYPNPFNPVAKIRFDIPKSSFVNVIIYNMLGEEITTLVNEELKPGTYEADFDGANLPSGTYFYRLQTDSYTETRKMVLLK